MSISDKIIQLNQVKQDIKQAIENKGVAMSGVPFTNYPLKINEISGGGETFDEYLRRLAYFYGQSEFDFYDIWKQLISDSSQQLYDIDVTLVAPAQNLGGMDVDLYIGSADLTNLYNDCVSSNYEIGRVFIINDVAVRYYGDIGGDIGFPIPIFSFGSFDEKTLSVESFLIADLTPLSMGLGISLAKVAGIPVANNNIVIKKGFDYNSLLLDIFVVFPETIKYVSDFAFDGWYAPMVILNPTLDRVGEGSFRDVTKGNIASDYPLFFPNSMKYIGDWAFARHEYIGGMLYLPNVITIGSRSFSEIISLKRVIIGDKVEEIGEGAFIQFSGASSIEYVEIHATTPPTLENANAFNNPTPYPIYVPDNSVDDYKTATNWVSLADRIFPISDK